MSTIALSMRMGNVYIRVAAIAATLAVLVLADPHRAAADQSAIAELNRQMAVKLRSVVDNPRPRSAANVSSIGAGRFDVTGARGPLGSHFTLPAWAAPFARANRLLSIHSGGFDFDGWNALLPRGVIRLKYTIQL
jgi:hypothetical protein